MRTLLVICLVAAVSSAATAAVTQLMFDARGDEITRLDDVVVTYQKRDGTLRVIVPQAHGQIVHEVNDFYGEMSQPRVERTGGLIRVICGEYVAEFSVGSVAVRYPDRLVPKS